MLFSKANYSSFNNDHDKKVLKTIHLLLFLTNIFCKTFTSKIFDFRFLFIFEGTIVSKLRFCHEIITVSLC